MRLLTTLLLAAALPVYAETTITLDAGKKGAEVAPTMYGIFFEDINYGADGGLYAEMVKNRSFEFPQSLLGWRTAGNVTVLDDGPFDRNPHYVRLASAGHRVKQTALENEGYFGIAVKKDAPYRLSFYGRVPDGGKATLRAELANPSAMGEHMAVAQEKIEVDSKDWKKYTVTLTPSETVKDGVLRIFLQKPDDTPVDLEHISLFPVDTWKGHENGLRRDLAEALYDLKPGVFRFPGGCIVEGTELWDRYQWKNTVGPVENRPTGINRWQFEFPHRFAPDYYQSNGLGFFEYFQLAEEIGAEPLPVLNVGMVCQYENRDPKAHAPVDSLQQYIQDCIDLVEFANGATDTKWGGLRASMGHPEPFNLKYIAIGNEQWGPEYVERLEPFVKEMRRVHPEIKLIGSSGPSADGKEFDYLWPEMRRLKCDLVDEHYYRNEDWFLGNAGRYDNYPRKGTKVFAGEYACHPKGKKYNSFWSGLCEAAFMTGLERNADVVPMATYAPLFAHEKGWQWRPDMIWFDNTERHLTPSYYVQQLYSLNKGTNVVQLTADGKALTGQESLYGSAVWDKGRNCYIVKLVNAGDKEETVNLNVKGLPKKWQTASGTLTTMNPPAEDSTYYDASLLTSTPLSSIPTSLRLAPRTFSLLTITGK